jgi:hypothetical protein
MSATELTERENLPMYACRLAPGRPTIKKNPRRCITSNHFRRITSFKTIKILIRKKKMMDLDPYQS